MLGRQIGHYEIIELLGAGGMGEVYRARDTRLKREVAIKVLSQRLLGDEQVLTRFEREAHLLASLNHPHIASIHGLEEDGGVHFLVLEYVKGLDLEKRLRQAPMALDEVISVARQVADALASAHRQGVIHRDLKPSNIATRDDGTIKILDFGLAKALDPATSMVPVSLSQSPTVIGGTTGANVILGTAAYMSPEQARGASVDPRTDVWAFGCVLFECLTGRRLFDGATVSDTLAAVLRDPISFDVLPRRTPPALRRLLRRCLERDVDQRLHGLVDVGMELDEAERELREGVLAVDVQPRGSRGLLAWLGWGVAAALAVVLGWSARESPFPVPDRPVNRFEIAIDSLEVSPVTPPAISPDGRRIVYSASGMLWIRELDVLDASPLVGTEGARGPFWAPDSANIGFQRGRQLFRTNIRSGHPTPVSETAEAQGLAGNGRWTEDGQIIFCSGDGNIYEVPASGGSARVLVAADLSIDDDFHTVEVLPDGRGLLFVSHRITGGARHLELFANGQRRELFELSRGGSLSFPVWDSSGYILFSREEESPGIWALPFSIEELRVTGEPVAVTGDGTVPSVAHDGTLIHLRGAPTGDHRIVRVDVEDQSVSEPLQVGVHLDDAAYSPSGLRMVHTGLTGSINSIFVSDLVRGTQTLLGAGSELLLPFWIDEAHVGALDADSVRVLVHDLERGAVPRTLLRMPTGHAFTRWTTPPSVAAGRIVFSTQTAETGTDVWLASFDAGLEAGVAARPLLDSPAMEREGQLSPDGELIAWVSGGGSGDEVYLGRLAADGTLMPRRWQVSSLGGETPRWSRDGSELYYATQTHLAEVTVRRVGDELELSRPRLLFELSRLRVEVLHGYSTCPEPGVLLMTQIGAPQATGRSIVVVQNWAAAIQPN